MAMKRRRLIAWQCCCGNVNCGIQKAADSGGFGGSTSSVEPFPGECDFDGAGSAICVDTHCHLNEVFIRMQTAADVPSLEKSWDAMTDVERHSWTVLGWTHLRWNAWKVSGGNEIVWQKCVTKFGSTYYWNTRTDQSSWEKPDDFDGDEHVSAKPDVDVDKENSDVDGLQMAEPRDPCAILWEELYPHEREAAAALGYTEPTWDQVDLSIIPSDDHLRRKMPAFACISTGCDPDSLEHMLLIHRSIPLPPKSVMEASSPSEGFPGFVWASLGCHPKTAALFSLDYLPEAWEKLEEFEARLRVVAAEMKERLIAWGEIGLDYSHPVFGSDKTNQWFQQEAFKRQIAIGVELGLPLVIHARDAWEDTMWILTEHVPPDYPIHVHCFWESMHAMDELFTTFPKAVLGFTNNLFYPGDSVQDLCRCVPLEHVVLETDAPYLPRTGCQMSIPRDILSIGRKVAEIKGIPIGKVMEAVRQNVLRIYGI